MRILVTGAGGFAGRHLINKLSEESGAEIFGTYHTRPPGDDLPGKHYRVALENHGDVSALVSDIRPDEVYHLAAVSFMPDAMKNRLKAYETNVAGGISLLEALSVNSPESRFLYTSSADVYGKIDPSENPVTEEHPAEPQNAYAATKLCFEIICGQYAKDSGLHIVIARPFNHTGPGQDEKFVAPAFAMQIARIEAGLIEPVMVTGNLDAERDFTDVRDVVASYSDMLRKGGNGGVYNVCSGKAVQIKHILDTLLGMSSMAGIKHEIDPARVRPAENPRVYGSFQKLEKLTGWRPSMPLKRTLENLLEDCRLRIKIKTPVDYQAFKR